MYLQSPTTAGRRRGATLAVTAVCLTAIVLLAALAIDCGNIMAQRRQAQNCADAAALAGCIQLAKDLSSGASAGTDITTAVTTSATANGYSTGVTTHYPPTNSVGGSNSDTHSVEVDIQFTYNNLIVGGNMPVTVRSIATCNPGSAPYHPMILLEPSAAKSFWVNSGKLTLNNNSIVVNSASSTAAVVDGLATSEADASVRVDGGSSGTFSPAAKTGFAPVADPYSLLPVPSSSGMTTYATGNYLPVGGSITLNPGYYPNGLCCINGGNVTLNAGTYLVEGGNFWINTTGTVTANGVTIIHNGGVTNTNSQLYQNMSFNAAIALCPSNSSYTFTPPTTGTYAGVSFFQTPNCTTQAIYDFWGTGNINTGIQYFPKSTLRAWSKGSGGAINCNQLVALDFKVSGPHEYYGTTQNGGFSPVTWNASKATNAPSTTVVLVE
jgi:hypothetical protein